MTQELLHKYFNAQSTLSYSSNFGRNDRNVELDGEAYFEVAKNKASL